MKLLLLLSATLAVVSATSEPRFCSTKSRGRLAAKQCVFPFVYKGVSYDSCTTVDTINEEAWCATRPTVRFTRSGKVLRGDVGDCDFTTSCFTAKDTANSCASDSDCRASGKLCDPVTGLQDVGCICKRGECNISSGCGTHGAFFFKSCSDCDSDLDGCEDEGACRISRSRSGLKSCVSK